MSTFNETPFTGVAVKVKMVCYPGGMCPPDGGDVIQQKLSINANGRANYTTMEHYFPVDLIRSGGRWEKRNIGPEQAADLLSAIAEPFRTLDEFCVACDAGMWDIEIENADGEIFKYSGFSIPGCFAKAEEISNRIRTELWLDDFYAFDGGYYEEEKEYIYCRVAVDVSSGLRSYWYIADTADFEVGCKVIVPFGRENNEVIGEIIDIEPCSEDDVPFPIEKTKHILRAYDDEEFDPPVIMGSEPLPDVSIENLREALAGDGSEETLARVYASVFNKVGWLMHDVEDDDCSIETIPQFHAWSDFEDELRAKILDILRKDNAKGLEARIAENRGYVYVIKPFMEQHGFRDGRGWWVEADDSAPKSCAPAVDYAEIRHPRKKKEDILKYLKTYGLDVAVRKKGEPGCEYLADDVVAIEVTNPEGGDSLWIYLENQFVMAFGDCEAHYYADVEEYSLLKKDIDAFLKGEKCAVNVYSEGDWVCGGLRDLQFDYKLDEWELLRTLVPEPEYIAMFEKDGGEIVGSYWHPGFDYHYDLFPLDAAPPYRYPRVSNVRYIVKDGKLLANGHFREYEPGVACITYLYVDDSVEKPEQEPFYDKLLELLETDAANAGFHTSFAITMKNDAWFYLERGYRIVENIDTPHLYEILGAIVTHNCTVQKELGHSDTDATSEDGTEWRWCLVGNIVETHPFGEEYETRVGTKHFPPGAKVFIAPAQWGDGMEKVVVIGKPRGRRPYIEVVMPSKHIENFRLQKVYRPAVLKRMAGSEHSWWGNNDSDRDMIQAFINSVNR